MKRLAVLSLFAGVALYSFSAAQNGAASPSASPAAQTQPQAAAPATEPAAAAPAFSVDSIAVAYNVESRAPVGIKSEFPPDIGKVSCWAKVSSSRSPVSLKFVWYKDGLVVFEWPYSLITETGRIWSTKSVSTGKWKVEVIDGAKNVIKSIDFQVN